MGSLEVLDIIRTRSSELAEVPGFGSEFSSPDDAEVGGRRRSIAKDLSFWVGVWPGSEETPASPRHALAHRQSTMRDC